MKKVVEAVPNGISGLCVIQLDFVCSVMAAWRQCWSFTKAMIFHTLPHASCLTKTKTRSGCETAATPMLKPPNQARVLCWKQPCGVPIWIQEADEHHLAQIQALKDASVDIVSAFTMNCIHEAIGIVHATKQISVDSMISFTVKMDSCLPMGKTIKEAVQKVDMASNFGLACHMIDCAHPTHFGPSLQKEEKSGKDWMSHILGEHF